MNCLKTPTLILPASLPDTLSQANYGCVLIPKSPLKDISKATSSAITVAADLKKMLTSEIKVK